MTVKLTTPLAQYENDLTDVIRLFWGDISVSFESGDVEISHVETRDGDIFTDIWTTGGISAERSREIRARDDIEFKRLRKRAAKACLYELMKRVTGVTPPWGALTGIRPTRLLYEAIETGMSADEAAARMKREYDVSDSRVSLIRDIYEMQKGLRAMPEGAFDLYIGIPFCATRCAYCSFSSGAIGDGRLVEPYVGALLREIGEMSEMMRGAGMKVRAAYMGGGTPTSISAEQLSRVLSAAMEGFPGAVEWTVEAGRPDTIDEAKLRAMKALGVTRISVNPQTFSDETLARIGRAHTGADTLRAYCLAREMGFDDINMDLIAALPGESFEDFSRTLDKVIELAPESVTVHSLAIKRSSKLHERLHVEEGGHLPANASDAGAMIASARERLTGGGWRPYYLYRQKYMAGNLENVGYAVPGRACLYNIGNMEETASVLALGAGAISKWIFERELRIERAPNVKNIEEYTARVGEMCERKRRLIRP